MILPIIAFGHPTLREIAKEVAADHPGLEELVKDMYETMYNAAGVGLAAPQVDVSIRLFVVDGSPLDDVKEDDEESLENFKQVFINPQKVSERGDSWIFEEGCLSIPDIREDVRRLDTITLRYFDMDFEEQKETFSGLRARIVQHEYDHLNGILFTDMISTFRRRILKPRLTRISKGQADVPYPMKHSGNLVR